MTYEAKVVLYFMGTVEEMIAKGYAKAKARLSKEGYREYMQLKASGFKPTDEELQDCLALAVDDPHTKLKLIRQH